MRIQHSVEPMNAPIKPALLRAAASPQAAQPAALHGCRYVWEGKFGEMVIEVIDGRAYVNGQAVEPVQATQASMPGADDPIPGSVASEACVERTDRSEPQLGRDVSGSAWTVRDR